MGEGGGGRGVEEEGEGGLGEEEGAFAGGMIFISIVVS